jgi:hypothetical protein
VRRSARCRKNRPAFSLSPPPAPPAGVGEGEGCVRCSFRFGWSVFLWSNKPDLELSPLLPVICILAMVAGRWITEVGQMVGSEAPGVPLLEISSRCALCVAGHRGGGDGAEIRWNSLIWRLGKCSLSSELRAELRRQLLSSENGGRQPVSLSSSVTQMAEGRPQGADASADASSSSSSRLEAIGEAVLQLLGVHPTLLWLEAMGWRAGGPKWFVPGGGRIVSVRWRQYGPDCCFRVRFEVLLVNFRDCSVFSFLLCPLVRFVLSQLHI